MQSFQKFFVPLIFSNITVMRTVLLSYEIYAGRLTTVQQKLGIETDLHNLTEGSNKSPLYDIANIRGFKFACININSLYRHIDEIRCMLMTSPLEILAINESKLDDSFVDEEVSIPGYTIERRDRNRYGGGVVLYVRENLPYTIREDLVPVRLEMICVEINLPYNRSFLVSTWYRPPSAAIDLFEEL